MASKKKMPAGLLDPESERIAEAYAAIPSVKRQTSGLLSLEPQKEQSMGRAAFEMLASFIPGVSQALAARDLERARRANDPAAAAMAAASFVPFGRLAGLGKKAGPVMSELDVYHGSPHQFDEFDASKIGTGEGAQAYGHGIYLAESPGVARSYIKTPDDWAAQADVKNSSYRKAQSEIIRTGRELRKQFPTLIPKDEISPFMYVESNKSMFPKETIEKVENIRKTEEKAYKSFSSGSFYKADLPDDMIDRMLDWDKPLSEQPEAVRKALRDVYNADWLGDESKQTGQDLYKRMGKMHGDDIAAVSRDLRDIGIPGIRYLDAGSRGQGGSGTRNFVVFPGEEKKVKIKKRE